MYKTIVRQYNRNIMLEQRIINSHFQTSERQPQNYLARAHYSDHSEDLRYLNIFVSNNDTIAPDTKKCEYNEYRTNDFFSNGATPSNYNISVQRATIPCNSIPLFIWDDVDDLMAVVMSTTAGGTIVSVTTPLVFVSSLSTPVATDKMVWYVDQWLKSVNNAYQTCLTALIAAYDALAGAGAWAVLVAANTAPASTEPPLLVYDDNNNFYFKLVPEYVSNNNVVNVTGLRFGWNQYLENKFVSGFNATRNTTTNIYQVIVENTGQNYNVQFANLFTIYNQFYIYDGLIQCKKLLILTDMGIDTEQTNSFYKYYNTSGGSGGAPTDITNSSNVPIKILLDMAPNFDLKSLRGIVNYLPTNVRYYNINASEFKTIQFKLAWSGQDGILRDLYLDYKTACSVKFLFTLR